MASPLRPQCPTPGSLEGCEQTTLPGEKQSVRQVTFKTQKYLNKYVNDYQLLLVSGGLQEQRKLLKGQVKAATGREMPLKLDGFLGRKIVMAPLALLAPESQQRLSYRFVKYDTLHGVKTAVIECFPNDIEGIYPSITRIVLGS